MMCVEWVVLVEKTADWEIGFVVGGNKHKRKFWGEVSQGKLPPHILRILWMHKKMSDGMPNFSAQIAAKKHPEAFFDGTDELLVKAQGANRWLLVGRYAKRAFSLSQENAIKPT